MFTLSIRWPSAVLIVAIAATGVLATPRLSQAGGGATINVNTTDDVFDDGLCSLPEAVEAANTNAAGDTCTAGTGADTVNVPAGTYVLSSDLDVFTDMQIVGVGAGSTILSTDGNNRIFSIFSKGTPTVDISDLTVRDGVEGDGDGGGIYASADLTLTNVHVLNNEANDVGGGIYNNFGTLTLISSVVSDNLATQKGGGIYHDGDSKSGVTLTIVDSTISDNTAPKGAGLLNSSGAVEITGSTFSGNDASQQGGALLNTGENMMIVNSTISGNTGGTNGGGGIFNRAPVTLTNVTIAGNTSEGGGDGINSDNEANFQNTIISYNGDLNCGGTQPVTSLGSNLEEQDAVPEAQGTCEFLAGDDLLANGPSGLGPLADNGGPTQTHALLAGSPAIDTADDSACPETDQRGVARPQDGDDDGTAACDIGAFELEGAAEPTPTATEQPPDGNANVDVTVSDDSPEVGDTVDISVAVTDDEGNAVAGAECTFEITDQPGDDAVLEAESATTDASGIATVGLSVGETPGTIEVTADCGAFGSEVLEVIVSPAGLPPTGEGGTNGSSGSALAIVLAVLALAAVGGAAGLALRRS
ncbi:MAG: choice-of-anchor Q domain-containing protein [Dehalococcoidia bacterium]